VATVPDLIHRAVEPDSVKVGLKIFNSMFNDEFQLEMLELAHRRSPARADFLVYANRLFDPDKVFLGKKGVAYGGPDLSARNLSVLKAWRQRECALSATGRSAAPLPISGTGDIGSGRMAAEYLLQGCGSFQIHTLFQLPNSEFAMNVGSKIDRALHRLFFDPEEGFLAWLCHLRKAFGWPAQMNVRQMAEFCEKHRML
jgi:dihydroorotate dehydrogenase